jgi:hypothetical protein
MDSLKGIISDIRVFLYGGVLTLPLTIAGTLSILGLFTGNFAILFFLLGYLILVPSVAGLLNWILGAVFVGKSFNPFAAKSGDVCKLVIPYSTLKNPAGVKDETVVSSSWTAMVAFFIGYIFTNATQLYSREAVDTEITVTDQAGSDIDSKVANRKAQAIIAMISTIIFALIVLGLRYYTGCETVTGMIVTLFIFTSMGVGWYRALSSVGQDRLSDLFGIANRLLPPSAISNAPIACVPMPA